MIAHYFETPDADSLKSHIAAWQKKWQQVGLLAFLPESEKQAVSVLQNICLEKEISLAGALFPALIVDKSFVDKGMWIIAFESMPPYFLLPEMAGGGARQVANAVTALLARDGTKKQQPLFLIFDNMLPNIASILDGIFQRQGNKIHYTGVCAGSETFQAMPCLFTEKTWVGDGVLGFFLPESISEVIVHQNYPVSKTLMRASSAVGNRIVKIDGQPAFDVYQAVIKKEYGVELTHENFYQYGVHFPFGLITAADVLVRIPVGLGPDDSLLCVAEVPPDSMLRLIKAPDAENSQCMASMTTALKASGAALAGNPLLCFFCAGRRLHLGEGAVVELSKLKELTGASLLVGALSLGEIDQSPDFGMPRFHNAAFVCAALTSNEPSA